jgi:hypothetical protein
VSKAIRLGHLQRASAMTCLVPDCGRSAAVWHHDVSHESPYELHVVPLCNSHHGLVHSGRVPEPRTGEVRTGERRKGARGRKPMGYGDAIRAMAHGRPCRNLPPVQRAAVVEALARCPVDYRAAIAGTQAWMDVDCGPERMRLVREDVDWTAFCEWASGLGNQWPAVSA